MELDHSESEGEEEKKQPPPRSFKERMNATNKSVSVMAATQQMMARPQTARGIAHNRKDSNSSIGRGVISKRSLSKEQPQDAAAQKPAKAGSKFFSKLMGRGTQAPRKTVVQKPSSKLQGGPQIGGDKKVIRGGNRSSMSNYSEDSGRSGSNNSIRGGTKCTSRLRKPEVIKVQTKLKSSEVPQKKSFANFLQKISKSKKDPKEPKGIISSEESKNRGKIPESPELMSATKIEAKLNE